MKQGWEIKKLGEIILENKKSTLKSKGNEVGEYPFFISGMKVKTYNKSIIDGQNIYLPTGGNFYVHFYEGKASYSTDTWSLKTSKNTDIKYFYFFLLLNRGFINEKHFKGATIKHLQKNDFREIKIPLPPLTEQKSIVAILDEAFAAIAKAKANAEQNLKNTKELFESYLQSVFENKGEDWEEKTLGELATFRNGMNFSKNGKGEKIYIVGVKDFKNSFWVPFETLEMVILDGKLNKLDQLNEGDIIAVRSNGNPQLIGRTLLASEVNGCSRNGFGSLEFNWKYFD
jgi:type I restriction enzyme S subunit